MELLTPGFGLVFYTLITFLIVLFLLRKFAWNPILKMLNERESNIANSIASAEKMKQEMSQMQADNERLLTEAREERSRLLKDAKAEGERMVTEAKDKAKNETARILADAQQQIIQQKNAAMTEVKNEIGKLSIAVAEKIVRKELSGAQAQNDFIDQLAGDINLN